MPLHHQVKHSADNSSKAVANQMGGGKGISLPAVSPVSAPPVKVVQRDVILTVNAGIMEEVVVNRDNEMGIFDNGPGDHLTAHVVFRDMIRNHLINQPLAGAPAILQQLYDEVWQLPGIGMFAHVPGHLEDNFDNADDAFIAAQATAVAAPTAANVQAAAQALLNLRNSVPLSAFDDGRVGAGEGSYRNKLNTAEASLREDHAFDIATLRGVAPFNNNESAAVQLGVAVVRLLDTGRIGQELEGEVDTESTPGITGVYDRDINRIGRQHLRSIAMAYPNLWANFLAAHEVMLLQQLVRQMEIGHYRDEEYSDEKDSGGKRKRLW